MTDQDSMIESTDGWTLVQLQKIAAARLDTPSYHLFSESNARGQIFNLGKGGKLRPTKCDGCVLLMPITGLLQMSLNGVERTMAVGSQILINPDVEFSVVATEASSIQIVWAPPFSKVEVFGPVNEA